MNNAHSLLIICRQAPTQIALAQAAIDAALAAGIFEQHLAVAFIGNGVEQLCSETTPAGEKNLAAQIQALPLYGIEHIYVDDAALRTKKITAESLQDLPHQTVNSAQLRQLMNQYDHVMTF
jgi:tRNA 2-thiouridine synthesizing protein C